MTKQNPKKSLFAGFSLFFYGRKKLSAGLWIGLLIAGIFSYGIWLNREGFPSIQVPIGAVSGAYFVDDSRRVDQEVVQPLSQTLLKNDAIESVSSGADNSSFRLFVTFKDDIGNQAIERHLNEAVNATNLPPSAQLQALTFNPAKYLNEYDMLLSVYGRESQTLGELEQIAESLAQEYTELEIVVGAEVISPFTTTQSSPGAPGQTYQTEFSRIGLVEPDGPRFYRSINIGISGNVEDSDIIELSRRINEVVSGQNVQSEGRYGVVVSADFAPSINTQIGSLQENVLSGLLAVSIVSLVLITWRAALITALFIISVVMTTMFVLYLIGISINTISLFGLVLALGLFVDDATIVVEAIDASRKRKTKSEAFKAVVEQAVAKVGSASFAGTATTILVFLPLVFVSGILGEFIRILPLSIITALIVSLVLSLSLIPFLSRFILKPADKNEPSIVNRWQSRAAGGLAAGLHRLRGKNGVWLGVGVIFASIMVIASSALVFNRLEFNIFPPSKDTDQLRVQINYPAGTDIARATAIAEEVDKAVVAATGDAFLSSVYVDANARSAVSIVELTPFDERDVTSPQILERLKEFNQTYPNADVRAVQLDPGPPAEEFPFKVQLFSEDVAAAQKLSQAIVERLTDAEIERPNGTRAKVIETSIVGLNTVTRLDNNRFIEVQAAFDSDDTTALVQATQQLVEEEFTQAEILQLTAKPIELGFDFGQESENQDSFASLALIGPISVLAMFALLAIQFRSWLQPLLIFTAIPFSFLGVGLGLYLSNNPISFFSMIGFFGLIGIAVNNTILMTDYANQERRNGLALIDAVAEAIKKRFRPLLATSITTVAALTPLALTDPFWESLAVTIIFGLLSSTLLVILAFPYYYVGVEWLRRGIKQRFAAIRR